MSKRGVLELQTPSGWIEVEVGDPSVLQYTPIEVQTPNGWAVPRVVDPAEADTPLEVKTPNGWMGIARRVFRMIDSFEDQDLAEYYTASDHWTVIQDASLATHGEYVLENSFGQGGSDAMWSDSGMGLDHYPVRGDTFKTNHQLTAQVNGCGHQFGCSGDGTNIYPDGYSARVNFRDNSEFRIIHQDPDGSQGGEYTVASTLIDMTAISTADAIEIKTTFGDPTITSTLYDADGSEVATISGDDTDFNGEGFGWISTIDASLADEQYVWHDFARITT